MNIQGLTIVRRPDYDAISPNQLVGYLQVTSGDGSMEVKLSPEMIAEILLLVQKEALQRAQSLAQTLPEALAQAEHELLNPPHLLSGDSHVPNTST